MKMLYFAFIFFAVLVFINQNAFAANDANNKTQDNSYSEKDKFIKEMKEELNKINMELKDLEKKAQTLSKQSRGEAQQKIKVLKNKTAQLNTQIDKSRKTAASSWNGVKSDFNKSFSEMKSSLDQTREWLSNKIAPKQK